MDESALFDSDGPGIQLLAVDPSPLADLIFRWREVHSQWAICRLRGHKCLDQARLFDEAGAALQFPYYFGENWNAFWECITDLSWLWRPSFLVVVDRADLLLRDSPDGFKILMQLLHSASEHWRKQQGDFDGELRPVAFHTLLACPSDSLTALSSLVNSVGVPTSRLELSAKPAAGDTATA